MMIAARWGLPIALALTACGGSEPMTEYERTICMGTPLDAQQRSFVMIQRS